MEPPWKIIPSYRIALTREEMEAVKGPLLSGNLCKGTEVKALERDFSVFVGKRYAAATASGTAALHLSLLALDVGEGSEVLMPSYVCSAVLNSVRYVGATPVLCEVAKKGFLIDHVDALEKLTSRTRAVIVPEMFGYKADIRPFRERRIPVLLDQAMSLGSKGEASSDRGEDTVSVFSFYATKVITSGQGGLVATDVDEIAVRVKDLRAYDKRADGRVRFNYTLTDFQSALAREQLARLGRRLKRRREIISLYLSGIDNPLLELPPAPEGWNCQRFVVTIPGGADAFIKHLKTHGITAVRPVFQPLHRLLGIEGCLFPVTEKARNEHVAIPCFPDLSPEEISRVIEAANLYRGGA